MPPTVELGKFCYTYLQLHRLTFLQFIFLEVTEPGVIADIQVIIRSLRLWREGMQVTAILIEIMEASP